MITTRTKVVLSLTLSLLLPILAQAQFEGLWAVTKVSMGNNEMTPTARWIRFKADGTQEGGNGWTQHSVGTWKYDTKKQLLSIFTVNAPEDPGGPFSVKKTGDNSMQWSRPEEGSTVIVRLERIDKLPAAPADEAIGLWNLARATRNGEDITAEFTHGKAQQLFLRWDRIYQKRSDGERRTGYWVMHGHRPDLTMLSHSPNTPAETWRVTTNEDIMELSGRSDSNTGYIIVYQRTRTFN